MAKKKKGKSEEAVASEGLLKHARSLKSFLLHRSLQCYADTVDELIAVIEKREK